MPCPFRNNVVLVANALSGLFIHPAPTTQQKGYTLIPQREIIYLGCLIEPVRTVCMTLFRCSELIMFFQLDYQLATLKTFTIFLSDGSILDAYYIKIIKDTGRKHIAYQLLKNGYC